ncbi:minor histocompatibility antigen H13 [Clonorchis sinensis]|uniref:Minor histocompatibility antigen H13 n=1 Tax=Clonorchis sinensis TaxID=79923 RepID=G7Y884_CLOSI|nr:minor histocompatibility antigen H13 [Clonorchis sinensis]
MSPGRSKKALALLGCQGLDGNPIEMPGLNLNHGRPRRIKEPLAKKEELETFLTTLKSGPINVSYHKMWHHERLWRLRRRTKIDIQGLRKRTTATKLCSTRRPMELKCAQNLRYFWCLSLTLAKENGGVAKNEAEKTRVEFVCGSAPGSSSFVDSPNEYLTISANFCTRCLEAPEALLFILAIVPIYFGSFMSQNCRDKVIYFSLTPVIDQANVEVITARDAATFPAYASAALFGVFLLFKFIPKEYINLIVNLHLSFIGIGCMFHVFSPTLSRLFPKSIKNHMFKAEFSKSLETESGDTETHWEVLSTSSVSLESKEIAGLVVAAGVGTVYFFTRHWLPNNFLAVCLSLVAIENIRLNKFVNGFMLLGGLFFYDIFWVFGTPVMVSVAKTLDAPIKVTFPRDFLAHGIFGKQLGLLGLGDIVVPGVFVAMLLRFDYSLNRSGSLKYFYTGYVAYIIGLLTTFIVMLTFNAAQSKECASLDKEFPAVSKYGYVGFECPLSALTSRCRISTPRCYGQAVRSHYNVAFRWSFCCCVFEYTTRTTRQLFKGIRYRDSLSKNSVKETNYGLRIRLKWIVWSTRLRTYSSPQYTEDHLIWIFSRVRHKIDSYMQPHI